MSYSEKTNQFARQLLEEYSRMDRSGLYGLCQRMLAYNSNRIEGSTLTERQTANIFETGMVGGEDAVFRTKDIEEMTGHFAMFNYMLQTYEQPLTETLIKQYHYHLKAGVFEDLANHYPVGEYKNRRNIVSDIKTADPEQVPYCMSGLLQAYEGKTPINLEELAVFHAQFERIHPFQDGNGRVGRMILFKECLRHDLTPVLIENDMRFQYYRALNIAQQQEDYTELTDFFQTEQDIFAEKARGFLWEPGNME